METAVDFVRPQGTDTGILLNTNLEALQLYKKAKKRMKRIDILESEIKVLNNRIDKLQEMMNAFINS